jgi:hypothetical protein
MSSDTPDYAAPSLWLCHPAARGACDVDIAATVLSPGGRVVIEPNLRHADPGIDCFYVYPTVSSDTADASDLQPDDAERNAVRLQFARFGAQCRLFAPVYRQRTVASLVRTMSNGRAAPNLLGQGYDDIKAAWRHYLAHDNAGRGIVLVGHSQGARVLMELILDEIEGRPVQRQLVSALLIGVAGGIQVPRGRDVGGTFTRLPVCRRPAQFGCVIAYSAYRRSAPPPAVGLFGRASDSLHTAVCTNPAALEGGEAELRGYLDSQGRTVVDLRGSAPWTVNASPITTPMVRVEGLLRAQCVTRGPFTYLEVTVVRDEESPASRDIQGDGSSPRWGIHIVDVELAIGDLVTLVGRQSEAYLASRARSPAGQP